MRSALWVTGLACGLLLALPARAERVVILGEVLDRETRMPIADVGLRLLVPGGVRAEARSDASGAFLLETETFAPVLILEASAGPWHEGATLVGVKSGRAVTVYLQSRGAGVGGTVTDRVTGRPVPYAPVQLGTGATVLGSTLTDAAGRYWIPIPQSGTPTARASALDARALWLGHASPDYLPLVRRDLASDPATPLGLEGSLRLMPAYGVLRVECLVATTGAALRQARVRVGGRFTTGLVERMTDAGGALVLRVPVWERPDLPLEENRLRGDYHVSCRDGRFGFVQATGLTVPPGVSETPGLTVVLSLVTAADATGAKQSTYSLVTLDPGEEGAFAGVLRERAALPAPPPAPMTP